MDSTRIYNLNRLMYGIIKAGASDDKMLLRNITMRYRNEAWFVMKDRKN